VATEKIIHSFVSLDKFPYSTFKKEKEKKISEILLG
jgi:hypothetical protein